MHTSEAVRANCDLAAFQPSTQRTGGPGVRKLCCRSRVLGAATFGCDYTRHVRKNQNFVNCVWAVVLAVRCSSVLVRTHCGEVISVFPHTDNEILIAGQHRRVTCLPLRLGLLDDIGRSNKVSTFWYGWTSPMWMPPPMRRCPGSNTASTGT